MQALRLDCSVILYAAACVLLYVLPYEYVLLPVSQRWAPLWAGAMDAVNIKVIFYCRVEACVRCQGNTYSASLNSF